MTPRFNRFLFYLLLWGLMYVAFKYVINNIIRDLML